MTPRLSLKVLAIAGLILQMGFVMGYIFLHSLAYAIAFVVVAVAVDIAGRYLQHRQQQTLESQKASNNGPYRSREAEPPAQPPRSRLKIEDLVFLTLLSTIFLKNHSTLQGLVVPLLLGSVFFLIWKGRQQSTHGH